MSTTPPLTGFQAAIDRVTDPHVKLLFNLAFNRIGNHAQAFGIQQAKINSIQKTSTTAGITVVGGAGGGGTPATSGILTVNNQSGQTAYTTQTGDNGALIVLSDASPVALSLSGSAPPYGVIVANMGAGLVTVTPATPPSGTSVISYAANPGAASMPLPSGQMAIIGYDGVNFWAAVEVMPQTFAPVLHEWLKSYDATTGLFTATRPDYSDLTGTPQLPNTIAPVAGEYLTGYDATTGNFSQSTPAGISVTIVTAQLTPTGAQGSMTFTDGRLTAQTQST